MAQNNKYTRSKIYRLVNDIDTEIYIGSTCKSLAVRKAKHKYCAKQNIHQNVYSHLNQVGWDNVHIILIENYPCDNIDQLRARERYWIEELKPSLNKKLPLRTDKEWRAQNIDKVKQNDHQYYLENKNTIKERAKQYHEENIEKIKEYYKQKVKCECGCDVLKSYMTRHIKTRKHLNLLSH